MSIPLVFVVGPRNSGKSAFSRMLAKHLGVQALDTSSVAIRLLAQINSANNPQTILMGGMDAWERDVCMRKEFFLPALCWRIDLFF